VAKKKSWMVKYLESMVGGKITSVGETVSDEDEVSFPYFIVKHPKYGELKVEVSRDEEGNGPGFLFGLIDPPKEK